MARKVVERPPTPMSPSPPVVVEEEPVEVVADPSPFTPSEVVSPPDPPAPKLKNLEEDNAVAVAAHNDSKAALRSQGNGYACPLCEAELFDSTIRFDGPPPFYVTRCQAIVNGAPCTYRGQRFLKEGE